MANLSPYFTDRQQTALTPSDVPFGGAAEPYYDAGIGLADCWKTVRRRSRFILGLIAAVMLVVAGAVWLMTPQYEASATLLINPEAPHLMDASTLLQQMQNQDESDYNKTQFALLQSDQVIARVITDLKLQTNPEFMTQPGRAGEAAHLIAGLRYYFGLSTRNMVVPSRLGVSQRAIDFYRSRLRIAPVSETRLVTVNFRSPDRDLAADVVNAHVRDYLSLSQELQEQSGDAARAFLEKELSDLKVKVEQSEAALNDYRSRMGILSFGVEDRARYQVAEQRMSVLSKELEDAQNQQVRDQAEMELVRSGDYNSLPEVVDNPMIESLKPQVDMLEAQYAQLSAKYTDDYPELIEVKSRLRTAEARVAAETDAIARSIQRNYAAATTRREALSHIIDQERKADFALNSASLQDAILAREVDTNRQMYKDVLKRMQEISVNGGAPVSNVSIVESAIPPPLPSSPKKVEASVIGGLLAAIVGISLAFMFEQFDDRLKSGDDIEQYLHLPQLGTVPNLASFVPSQNGVRRLLAKPQEVRLTKALPLLCEEQNAAWQKREPGSGHYVDIMEAYRSIRAALLYSRAGSAPKTILFISAVPGEGKTMTASGTAWAFAQTGARTLLIDTDLRKPSCHKVLGAEGGIGISDVLVGLAEPSRAVQQLGTWPDAYQNLFFVGSGPSVPNPGELLSSHKMSEVLSEYTTQFRFVLLDSPPLALTSDTIALAAMVDGVVVVAGAATSRQTVKAVCRKLGGVGAEILGVVLNGVETHQGSLNGMSNYYSS